jgi:hypothetical protein
MRMDAPPLHVRLQDFWIAKTETTVEEYQRIMRRRPASQPKREAGTPKDFPVQVNWREAMDFAEFSGKRLISEAEYEFVATNRGTTRFPWGDEPGLALPWKLEAATVAGVDVTADPPGVQGLFSNSGEWTVTAFFLPPGTFPGLLVTPPTADMLGRYVLRGFPPNIDSTAELQGLTAEQIAELMVEDRALPWTDRGARFRRAGHIEDRNAIRLVVGVRPRLERDDLQVIQVDDAPR